MACPVNVFIYGGGLVGVLLFSARLTACPEIPETGFTFLKFIMV
ncbi:hypothetical protein [Photorhabdus sp. CRCIA-P01]|nr:hypothetical protein [Photorhabdus sp. CRCIA-P01]